MAETTQKRTLRIGIDAGGTFTDFVVLHPGGRLETFKLRSNPKAPHRVILEGLDRATAAMVPGVPAAEVVHGSTVATNALLERKGARTAFVTTAGFEDLLEIGRQNRERLYDLTPPPRRLLIDPKLCFGVNERAEANGTISQRPHSAELRKLKKQLQEAGVESVAVCFLHAYQSHENEQQVAEALAGLGFLSVSHDVCPEFREFERASTTALNAYVGPLMRNYLLQLSSPRYRISVMQSNGGSLSLEEASQYAVRTVLSGPAGGVAGARSVGAASGFTRVLGFDMGGTSTDVSLIEGEPVETMESMVDGLPVRIPMLEIHTVGAGGGSLARIDAGGLLRVGPESAGADPGPACYGIGDQPTVTDAHVALGRIASRQLAGGSLQIDPDRARAAFQTLAQAMKSSVEDAAAGVLHVATTAMSRAIRVISVERGYDPADFALVAFGGCGGLHACDIAEELGVRTVLAPQFAGSLSALGMLLADPTRDFSTSALAHSDLDPLWRRLEEQALQEMPGAKLERSADLRYRGQSYELTVRWTGARTAAAFHKRHERIYGARFDQREVEVVTLRLRARRPAPRPRWDAAVTLDPTVPQQRRVWVQGKWRRIPVFQRNQVLKRPVAGPALLADYGSTTLVNLGWTMSRDAAGSIVLSRKRRDS